MIIIRKVFEFLVLALNKVVMCNQSQNVKKKKQNEKINTKTTTRNTTYNCKTNNDDDNQLKTTFNKIAKTFTRTLNFVWIN